MSSSAILRRRGNCQAELSGRSLFGARPPRDRPPGLCGAAPLRAPPAADPPAAELPAVPDIDSSSTPESPVPDAIETSHQADLETAVDTPKNVLPFRPISEPKPPALTPVENSAFDELARQLSARLDSDNGAPAPDAAMAETVVEQPAMPEEAEFAGETPEWLAPPEPPARGEARRDKALLDLVPVGTLIYQLDRLLYANPAFLARMG